MSTSATIDSCNGNGPIRDCAPARHGSTIASGVGRLPPPRAWIAVAGHVGGLGAWGGLLAWAARPEQGVGDVGSVSGAASRRRHMHALRHDPAGEQVPVDPRA